MRLDPPQTLRSFIVGSSNRLAVAMVRRALGRSALRPNPVLLVGDTSVGKSHLLHAAALEIRRTDPKETGRPVLMAMERRRPDYKYIEAYVQWFPAGVVAELGAPSVDQRVRAMRRAVGRNRLSTRSLTALARESTTIPLARAAAVNHAMKARLGL